MSARALAPVPPDRGLAPTTTGGSMSEFVEEIQFLRKKLADQAEKIEKLESQLSELKHEKENKERGAECQLLRSS